MTLHWIVYRCAYCVATWYLCCGVVLRPQTLCLSGIEESALTLVVLDVDGKKERF